MRLSQSIVSVGACWLIVVLFALPASSMDRYDHTEPTDQNAAVYPNPARDFIFFRIDKVAEFDSEEESVSLTVVDILGNPVTIQSEKVDANTHRVDVSQCAPGYYMLIVRSESEAMSKKRVFRFLKQ